MMLSVVYEPRGRAREYSPLALNLYRGCSSRCVYCYASDVLHVNYPRLKPGACKRLRGTKQ